ncbi:cupin domain-containing protein [Flaviaesturariibacter flavus]|uniref:Cupin domain-containing protein n=1 Tax=Flaviaesturariibacter flavus TaxID=2502780 RepID=A0A4R1BNC2_9BACT|nr:cupin domain-containing protein [Flaviaesturariibacter flavus]TCJ19024.1 cupin domain-containing protein [Flaviaesturariibacter flavus]
MKYFATLEEAKKALRNNSSVPFAELMRHGSLTVEWYAPQHEDQQGPHKQDELYIVASGHGTFLRDGEPLIFQKGDVIFVPAGMKHRFVDFSHDFATWVIFYGPDGGEK